MKAPGLLPEEPDTFVGATAALDALADELRATRIVTLSGPAGAGKSRWAAALARRAAPAGSAVPRWVDLTTATASSLAERVAVAMGAPTAPGVPAEGALVAHLRSAADLVVVLDGCDTVRREVGQLVLLIHRRCPAVRLVVTCREALAVPGERVRPVCSGERSTAVGAGDTTPDPWRSADAAELLRRHLTAGDRGLDQTAAVRVCAPVANLPLSIELVAAGAIGVPPAQRLQSLADHGRRRPTAAASGPYGLDEVLRWTWDLLAATDRTILGRLSVFQGAFSAVDAEAVAGGGLPAGTVTLALGKLVEAALLRRQQQTSIDDPPIPRFVVPTAIRRFAVAELRQSAESKDVSDRHAEHWAGIAAAAELALRSRQQEIWVTRLESRRDDLLAALRWLATDADPEAALRMAGALGRFWWLAGRFDEGSRALRAVLARPGAERPTVGRAAALHALGLATFWHETDEARARHSGACFEEASRIYAELGERHRLAWALRDLGSHHNGAGDLPRARELFAQSLDLAREIADVAAAGVAASYLGIAASYAGERAEARRRLEEAVVLLSGRGGADELVRAQFFLACLECDDRQLAAARARLRAMVQGNDVVPTLPYAVGFALDGLARLAAAEDRHADALRLAGAAGAAHARWGTSAGTAYAAYRDRGLATARRVVGENGAAAYAAEGSRWTIGQAVACGFSGDAEAAAALERLRPRELEVLRMVDQGLGDAEIARALVVSPRTVGNHLASVYRKLGVHSRTAAVHLLRRRGLLPAR